MSFFGSSHNTAAPGFGQAHDPFASISGQNDDADALDFEDTYDGLGDQLDETDDAFNDDTFGGGGGGGGGGGSSGAVGKDFDFFGQTASVANAIEEEHLRFNRQQPAPRAAPASTAPAVQQPSYSYTSQAYSKPTRTGYEKYNEPEPVPDLQADAALWGVAPKKHPAATPKPQAQTPPTAPARKILSLEEVEAGMRAQSRKPEQPILGHQAPVPPQGFDTSDFLYAKAQGTPSNEAAHRAMDPLQQQQQQQHGHGHPVTILQRPQSRSKQPQPQPTMPGAPSPRSQQRQPHTASQPTQILQNPNRPSADGSRTGSQQHTGHRSHSSLSRHTPIITHPSQLSHLGEDEKAAFLDQEAKRAKRNHKIFLLSRDNGLMTPQDKNFITRIQLQQLVAATGNPNEQGTDESLSEDFYYQVLNQIRGGQRQHPSQPLNNFAQTYLFQTGSRQGGMRRQGRGPENHMQRMEQQVQRAVEAAKNKPKNKQLVIEGSLGKISFSNAKTPKPLLNIKRAESGSDLHRPGSAHRAHSLENGLDKKAVLRNIEKVYDTLMKLEDHVRSMPPPVGNDGEIELMQRHVEWAETGRRLNDQLWRELKVHEPIGATPVHPFIAFLSFSKGKKAIPRVFQHLHQEQRTTILTMVVYFLDKLDAVRGAQVTGETRLNATVRENVELFSLSVMPTLFNFMNEVQLDIVEAILGLILNLNVDLIARTRVGVSMLTMILSRAELIKQQQADGAKDQIWMQWDNTYTKFFNMIEPTLAHIFPGSVNSGEDIYVWQFLAGIGIHASPEQQQRLVIAVKDRVMETVELSKTLPQVMASQRLSNVNLFMRSIGLDVDLLT